MSRKLFLNLPVKNLDASVAFFTKLGFTFDPTFTDDSATAMIVNEETTVMLLVEKRFSDFTKKPISDATAQTEAIMALSAESREEVDQLVATALAAGGSPSNEPQDHGFMYGSSFQDLDGHQWEVLWMDVSAMPQQ
ncbi:MAG: VOC family protein [Pseudonocardia sp.]|nr:VOC family protein [Pseudonocardia sp.]